MIRPPRAAAAVSVVRLLFEMTKRQGAALLLPTRRSESASRCHLRFCLSDSGLLPVVESNDADGGGGRPGPGASLPDAP